MVDHTYKIKISKDDKNLEYVLNGMNKEKITNDEKAKKLLVNDHVACVFGCWTSASRKAVLPVFEKENGMLYYPTFYEGLEQSKNVIYTGQEATQQILWGLDWSKSEKKAKSYFLIGSDYIWPRTSHKIARKHIENKLGGKVVGEAVTAMGDIEKSAQEISQIINVIDGIAFQTNLLALNAAWCFAARAHQVIRPLI